MGRTVTEMPAICELFLGGGFGVTLFLHFSAPQYERVHRRERDELALRRSTRARVVDDTGSTHSAPVSVGCAGVLYLGVCSSDSRCGPA